MAVSLRTRFPLSMARHASFSTALEDISVLETTNNETNTFMDSVNNTLGNSSITHRNFSKSTSTTDINSFYFYKTEQFTILWFLFSVIVVGNSAVLITLCVSKKRKSRMNFFIRQLAIADLTVGLVNVSTDIAWRITVAWYAGNILCKLIRFLQAVVTYSSTYVLVALSIDRYDAITHPMNFSGSSKRAKLLVILAWLVSIIFSLPTLFLFEEKPIEQIPQCWIDLQQWQWKLYMTLVSLALFVIPALIITTCYLVIIWTIWAKSRALNPMVGRIPVPLDEDHRSRPPRYLRDDIDSRRASSRGIIPRAKIKTVKMTFVIVFVFVLCWSPYIIFDLLQVYGHIPRTQTNIAVATLIQSLAPLNSAANPLIYLLFSTHICANIRKLLPTTHSLCIFFFCIPSDEQDHCLQHQNGSAQTLTMSLTQSSRRLASRTSLGNNINFQTNIRVGRKTNVSVV
ncbi:cardioacceleratory peptide receptor-like isoform X2 [Rhynchophorus ferrugineus]|uniref:cardioacceleratory peptide receptor-like isoform X2 n=1 Tax=Rhynchophorus ferrugineus TaxID=354439 RepID=UPI003FCC6FC0